MIDVGAWTLLFDSTNSPLITAETATRRSVALAATMTGSLLDFQVLERAPASTPSSQRRRDAPTSERRGRPVAGIAGAPSSHLCCDTPPEARRMGLVSGWSS
jgi:hypothetical protein